MKENGKKTSISGATIAKYVIVGILIFSMVGSMFAYLISAIQSV